MPGPDPTTATLREWIDAAARARGDRPLVLFGDQTVSYAGLGQDARRIAAGFAAAGIRRGDRVGVLLLNRPEYLQVLAGLFTLGTMIVTTVLLVGGYGLRLIGVPPSIDEIIRLFLYVVFAVVYGAFWMGLSILFSVVFRGPYLFLSDSVGTKPVKDPKPWAEVKMSQTFSTGALTVN